MYISKTFFFILLFFASIGLGLLTTYLMHIVNPDNNFIAAITAFLMHTLFIMNLVGFGIAFAITSSLKDHAIKCYKKEYYQKLLERQSSKDRNEYYDDY